ncbi:tRNA uridine-5-carboxymethylaminomethyl(34) synthesis GTPase MnmE [Candidatus Rariloculus sp.]|uniref:tRNA uridine-5-carboxymethylaminomethyl(34) synthesis GTPase MnmE n=1 Tax=Candidatus Rariloculus sp. TaxID=3101265 RepID=UPI003D124F01
MNYAGRHTIAALATAPGIGAVAIVRISGNEALAIAKRLTGIEPTPRRAELCEFRSADGRQIDKGLLLFFPGPGSYTGEDVVELHAHGGPVVSDWLLETLHGYGARAAEPGEFTLRAFLNDKLDLPQAEAVADLVDSRSRLAARAALRSLRGRFSDEVAAVQAKLTELRVLIEAWLDFPDEEIDLATQDALAVRLAAIQSDLEALVAGAKRGSALSDALSVAIGGPPNAGKSSLLNRLAGYDAAIVTDVPGTTRDTVRERLSLDGVAIDIVDTAGLRTAADPVEREGVRRAQRELGRADHTLWVSDIRAGLQAAFANASAELAADLPYTLILNKVDLTAEAGNAFEHGHCRVIQLSALTGAGVELLIEHLKTLAGWSGEEAGTFSARRRHLEALQRARAALQRSSDHLPGALELAAEELRGAQTALSELTGELTSDDLLGEIFSSFCIGK